MPACRAGVISLVYGVPSEILEYLIAASDHPQGDVHRLHPPSASSWRPWPAST
jgi:hypothetical protein